MGAKTRLIKTDTLRLRRCQGQRAVGCGRWQQKLVEFDAEQHQQNDDSDQDKHNPEWLSVVDRSGSETVGTGLGPEP